MTARRARDLYRLQTLALLSPLRVRFDERRRVYAVYVEGHHDDPLVRGTFRKMHAFLLGWALGYHWPTTRKT